MIVIAKSILEALINRIDELFPDTPKNIESSSQGIKTPCFEIFKISNNQEREAMERLRYNSIYNVVYISDEKEDLFYLEEVERKLLQGLEHIYIGDRPLKGYINSTMVEKDISITAEYNYILGNAGNGRKEKENLETMKKLKTNIEME